MLIFSVSAFWQSHAIAGFSGLSTAGVFPMLASATLVISAGFLLLESLSKSALVDSTGADSAGFFSTILPLRTMVVIAFITAYVAAMPTLGFLIASGLFLLAAFAYLWRKPIHISLGLALFALISIYLIFRKLFHVVLPEGTLIRGWL